MAGGGACALIPERRGHVGLVGLRRVLGVGDDGAGRRQQHGAEQREASHGDTKEKDEAINHECSVSRGYARGVRRLGSGLGTRAGDYFANEATRVIGI